MANFTQYKRDRNQLRSLTRKLRMSFESMLTKELKKDPKPFWRYCNSRVKSQAKVGKITRPDGTIAKETEEKVAELSAFFSSVFTEEDKEVPTPEQVSTESIESLTITQDKVRSKLKGLSGSKTPGPDNIHPRILKETADQICVPLTALFNRSLSTGELPEDWKLGNISPVFKKGSKGAVENYRPISLTSQVSKILESIIRDEVIYVILLGKRQAF